MLRFFYSPGSCALASHVALEESGLSYTAVEVNLHKGDNNSAEYRAINPLGRVPALDIDGRLLTENTAILNYVADDVPEAGLLPAWGSRERIHALEWMAFLASIVHPGFRAIFRPDRFAGGADSAAIDEIRRRGFVNAAEAIGIVEQRLDGNLYALGDRFSLCDAYLLVFFIWSRREFVAPHMPATPVFDALAARVWQRPTVQAALAGEGLSGLDPWRVGAA
ncbi:MAG: putative glutathione S-transferase [Alphaproteobacteria bacterium]|nr:putative glutathione S-transferase [Alphaproteobacteria bacterium]